MQSLQKALEASSGHHRHPERGGAQALASYAFVTELPLIVVINVGEDQAAAPPPFTYERAKATIALCADTEEQIAQLEPADRTAVLEDLGVKEPPATVIQTCYDAVGLISFLTAGEDVVRALVRPQGGQRGGGGGQDITPTWPAGSSGPRRSPSRTSGRRRHAHAKRWARCASKASTTSCRRDILNIKFNV